MKRKEVIDALERIGQRFNKLEVLKLLDKEKGSKYLPALCRCDCGNEKIFNLYLVVSGKTKSCGCGGGRGYGRGKGCKDKTKRNMPVCYALYHTNINYISNQNPPKNNKSGHKGVYWDNKKNKWCAQITTQKKKIHLGRFDNIDDAINAREKAEKHYHIPLIEAINNSE